jgi:hypothetical protein
MHAARVQPMSRLLDTALVAAALLASVLYALYALGPKALRIWLRVRLAGLAAALHLGRLERRLREAAGASGACGGCDDCGSSAETGGAGREIRVPAASIGTRRSR